VAVAGARRLRGWDRGQVERRTWIRLTQERDRDHETLGGSRSLDNRLTRERRDANTNGGIRKKGRGNWSKIYLWWTGAQVKKARGGREMAIAGALRKKVKFSVTCCKPKAAVRTQGNPQRPKPRPRVKNTITEARRTRPRQELGGLGPATGAGRGKWSRSGGGGAAGDYSGRAAR